MASTVTDIIQTIQASINTTKAKARDIPTPLILIGARNKNGLSAREIAKEIIIRQQEAGAPIGPLPDGTDSIAEKMEVIRAEVLIEHLLRNAKITVVVPAGISITATGANSGGPVVVKGVTDRFVAAKGIIQ
jgi:hypothetical protein